MHPLIHIFVFLHLLLCVKKMGISASIVNICDMVDVNECEIIFFFYLVTKYSFVLAFFLREYNILNLVKSLKLFSLILFIKIEDEKKRKKKEEKIT